MELTVITICLNPGELIARTSASVAAQDHPGLRWVVIDGGSCDGTVERLLAENRKPDVLISEPDRGIADAFNKGLTNATGDAVWFMNAGDEFAGRDSVSALLASWDRSQYRWITGAAEVVGEDGQLLFVRGWDRQPPNPRSLVRWNCSLMHQAVLAERSLFTELGGFDEAFRIAMDYELWLRWIGRGIAPQTSDRVVCRFHRGGASGDPRRNNREDRRARAKHGLGNGMILESGLTALAWTKACIRGRYGRWAYRLKERLGVRI